MKYNFLIVLFLSLFSPSFAQNEGTGIINVDEYFRRRLLLSSTIDFDNFFLRNSSNLSKNFFLNQDWKNMDKDVLYFGLLPVFSFNKYESKRPYFSGEYGSIPSSGFQTYLSTGFYAKIRIFTLMFQPEYVFANNLSFEGFSDNFSASEISNRFLYWNVGDSPERFGNTPYSKFFLGQSSFTVRFGSFDFGLGTKNYWWGPGQWNSLIFSNNAPGFPHLSLNTFKPIKTFLGSFEGQLLSGRLESSGFSAVQDNNLNSNYFTPISADWRYLNGFILNYNLKWIPGLSLGFARTYQYYNSDRPKDFYGWFPVFEPMVKENFFSNGNSVIYDDRKQSQQITVFGSFKSLNSKAEIYFQFGRRDHSLNWREFILNPEHARAFQVGFIKLSHFVGTPKLLQVRGEITHQKESVNRYLRYELGSGITWHTHGHVRGFTNYGQPMGVGIGTGSNVQTLEVSVVEDWNKWGILFERLENNQDFYYRALGQQKERKPWIDWSTALLWNTSYKDLFISARLQGTYARNYQWGVSETSIPEFPVSQNLFSVHSQVNLIYFWERSLLKKD